MNHSQEHTDGGRFTGTIESDKTVNFTFPDLQRNSIYGTKISIVFTQLFCP